MLPDRVSNPGPLTYESGALPIAPRGPACAKAVCIQELNSTLPFSINAMVISYFVAKDE